MDDSNSTNIYCIRHSDTAAVVYVGIAKDFSRRKSRYFSSIDRDRPKNGIKAWVWDHLKSGKVPQIEVVEIVNIAEAKERKKIVYRDLQQQQNQKIRERKSLSSLEKFVTYCIKDPETGQVVYVGQTQNFIQRKKDHLKTSKKKRPNIRTENIRTYLVDLAARELSPQFEILEEVDSLEESLASETKWVSHFSNSGDRLLNRWKEHRSLIKRANVISN